MVFRAGWTGVMDVANQFMSISIFKSDAGSTVEPIFPPFSILTADRHKVLLCLIRWQLGEATVTSCWVISIGRHLSMVVVDLVLQATSRWAACSLTWSCRGSHRSCSSCRSLGSRPLGSRPLCSRSLCSRPLALDVGGPVAGLEGLAPEGAGGAGVLIWHSVATLVVLLAVIRVGV